MVEMMLTGLSYSAEEGLQLGLAAHAKFFKQRRESAAVK